METDSRLAYITCHLLCLIYNAAVAAGFIWLAYELRNGWVLLATILCTKSYKHDFNQGKASKGKPLASLPPESA